MFRLIKKFLQPDTPTNPTQIDYKKQGNEWLASGNLDAAAECYRQAINDSPNQSENYVNLGFVLSEQQQYDDAINNLKNALSINENDFDAIYILGVIAQKLNRLDEAKKYFTKVIEMQPSFEPVYQYISFFLVDNKYDVWAEDALICGIKHIPNSANLYYWLGEHYIQKNEFGKADDYFNKSLSIEPNQALTYCKLGDVLRQQEKRNESIECYKKAIILQPDFVEAYNNVGSVLQDLKKFDEASACFEKAINIAPQNPALYFNLGCVLKEQKSYENAILNYKKSIEINPEFADAYNNLGIIFEENKQFNEAIENYDKAISIKPEFAEAYFNRGNTLLELKQLNAAADSYSRAIALNPELAAAYLGHGLALKALNQFEEAVKNFDRAINLKHNGADAYFNRGLALQALKQSEAAVESYSSAITIKPDFAEAYVGRGLALQALDQFEAAVESYDLAIVIKPDLAEAYVSRGISLQALKQLEAAVVSYEKAMNIKPDFEYLLGTVLFLKMKLCDWTNINEKIADVVERIQRGEKSSLCFPMLSFTTSAAIQRQTAEIFLSDKRHVNRALGEMTKKSISKKIRIGYFSGDFHLHPVLMLMIGLFELHDKNRFELIAFSFGPDSKDDIRKRAEQAFDQFIDIRSLSDKAVAHLARDLNIDIAVDLGGYTERSCFGIFSYRAAPIQVNYLGYPGTMGADYFDYIIADSTIIPHESQPYYVEKIVYLPSYQPSDSTRIISEKEFTRSELGLPDEGFVFCCTNNNYKITPDTFDGWMRILQAVKGSVLLLCADTNTAGENLKKEAQARGVDSCRLIFTKRLNDAGEYLARYRTVDLFLDTFPYNAQATASDVLWTGLPLLTLVGETFTSRVAASLLNSVGLPELITYTQEDYEALAIELAIHPTKLNIIKAKLATNRLSAPLFNSTLYAKHIENAYEKMVERYHAGLTPDHINVESIVGG